MTNIKFVSASDEELLEELSKRGYIIQSYTSSYVHDIVNDLKEDGLLEEDFFISDEKALQILDIISNNIDLSDFRNAIIFEINSI